MELDLYQIDAFASKPFAGNPAAVCPLREWIDDALMQSIAFENNLSETAFFVDDGDVVALRWFTPTAEIELCGHATLAAGYLIVNVLGTRASQVRFSTLSGELRVRRAAEHGTGLVGNDAMIIDLPARPAASTTAPEALLRGVGRVPAEILAATKNYLVVYEREAEVRALAPDMAALATLHPHGVIATAPAQGFDFVSRYFAPSWGVPEDPATGSAHCTLAPYWSDRFGKTELRAFQASPRGAEIACALRRGPDRSAVRVELGGDCVLYLQGKIRV